MSLKIIEQIKILKGTPSPNEVSFEELVQQAAVESATNFFKNAKDISRADNPEAYQYLKKMREVFLYIIRRPETRIEVIASTLISKYIGTMAQVIAATDQQWEDFVVSIIFETIESVSGIFLHEKVEYDNLIVE